MIQRATETPSTQARTRTHVLAFRRDSAGYLQACEGSGASLLEARLELEEEIRRERWARVRP